MHRVALLRVDGFFVRMARFNVHRAPTRNAAGGRRRRIFCVLAHDQAAFIFS
jgi:hypothetical protein